MVWNVGSVQIINRECSLHVCACRDYIRRNFPSPSLVRWQRRNTARHSVTRVLNKQVTLKNKTSIKFSLICCCNNFCPHSPPSHFSSICERLCERERTHCQSQIPKTSLKVFKLWITNPCNTDITHTHVMEVVLSLRGSGKKGQPQWGPAYHHIIPCLSTLAVRSTPGRVLASGSLPSANQTVGINLVFPSVFFCCAILCRWGGIFMPPTFPFYLFIFAL